MIEFGTHGFGHWPKGFGIGPANWKFIDLIVVHAGRVELDIEGHGHLILSSRDAVLVHPQTPFHGKTLSKSHVSVQHFLPQRRSYTFPFEAWNRMIGLIPGCTLMPGLLDATLASDIAREIECVIAKDHESQRDKAVILLTLMLEKLLRQGRLPQKTSRPSLRVAQIEKLIQDCVPDNPSLDEIAKKAGLSKSRLIALFRENTGESPYRYMQRLRCDWACRKLREEEVNIKTLAYEMGFGEVPNFYRFFKQYAGVTPAQYLKSHKIIG